MVNTSTLIFVGLVLILVIFVLAMLAKLRVTTAGRRYQLNTYLLSKAERSFYGVLVQAVGADGLVFSKVRVADVLSPQKVLKRREWQRAFNLISAKHFDFVICDPDDCAIRVAVELDDSSHGSAKGKKRDQFLNEACESAGLRLIRIRAPNAYVVADIRQQLFPADIHPSATATTLSATQVAENSPAGAKSAVAKPQGENPCPKCGAPMVLRTAKSGDSIGQAFWGCSAFPKCRGVIKIGA